MASPRRQAPVKLGTDVVLYVFVAKLGACFKLSGRINSKCRWHYDEVYVTLDRCKLEYAPAPGCPDSVCVAGAKKWYVHTGFYLSGKSWGHKCVMVYLDYIKPAKWAPLCEAEDFVELDLERFLELVEPPKPHGLSLRFNTMTETTEWTVYSKGRHTKNVTPLDLALVGVK
ncbi:MAG: hypothetical protein JSS66_05565 [Armatimonadetes bacterium]|nr:hypothetical protein [Armatimonadota bacterium]